VLVVVDYACLKQQFAFDLFDTTGEGVLSISQTTAYFTSFMTALCALTSQVQLHLH
jgi:hypothetical protein